MNNIMEYQGYVGSVEFSQEDNLFYGKVMGIRSLISYEGTTAKELVEDFHRAVEDYLLLCKETGQAPEKAYKGSFNVVPFLDNGCCKKLHKNMVKIIHHIFVL